jgi:RNA polymerase sigma-70 factor (ECF subfamily)
MMEMSASLSMGPPEFPDSEHRLIVALRARDPRAFEELVRTYGGRMLAVARRFLVNEEDARDAIQDAFLSAFRAFATFDTNAPLGPWLHRIAINASLDKLRSKKRHPESSMESYLPSYQEDGRRIHGETERTESPEAILNRRETGALVRQSIALLPESYRTILLLRDIEGLDTAQTAQLLGISESLVKTRLHRARQALRTLLDPHLRREAL